MSSYIISIIATALLVTLGGLVSYSSGAVSRTSRSAMSLLLLYTVTMPILGVLPDLSSFDFDSYIYDYGTDIDSDGALYYEVTKEAFADGVRELVCEEYSLSEEEVSVVVVGFNFENMRADMITVILSGRAAYADARGIAETVTAAGLGECEVKVDI